MLPKAGWIWLVCFSLRCNLFQESKINIGVRNIFCVLEKAEKKWWKKLLRGDEKIHYVKVDWDKWVDEDDETGTIIDSLVCNFHNFDMFTKIVIMFRAT